MMASYLLTPDSGADHGALHAPRREVGIYAGGEEAHAKATKGIIWQLITSSTCCSSGCAAATARALDWSSAPPRSRTSCLPDFVAGIARARPLRRTGFLPNSGFRPDAPARAHSGRHAASKKRSSIFGRSRARSGSMHPDPSEVARYDWTISACRHGSVQLSRSATAPPSARPTAKS